LLCNDADIPRNMTFASGTPVAGDFAGTQYATEMVSALESQRIEVTKQMASQTMNNAMEMKMTKTMLLLGTEVKVLVAKAWSKVCQTMMRSAKD